MSRNFKFLSGADTSNDPANLQLSLNLGWYWTSLTEVTRQNGNLIITHGIEVFVMPFFDFVNTYEDREVYVYAIGYNGGVIFANDRYERPPFDPETEIVRISAIVI